MRGRQGGFRTEIFNVGGRAVQELYIEGWRESTATFVCVGYVGKGKVGVGCGAEGSHGRLEGVRGEGSMSTVYQRPTTPRF